MKRNHFRKSLQKIKKELETTANKKACTEGLNSSDPALTTCRCQDGNGEYKILYTTIKEAETMRENLQAGLRIYPCPSQKGWHLTKGS